jgi:hypothetical protein
LQALRPPGEAGGAPASSDNPSKFHEDPAQQAGRVLARARMKELDTHEP